MSKPSYNIEEASAGITDMDLKKEDSSMSTGNNACSSYSEDGQNRKDTSGDFNISLSNPKKKRNSKLNRMERHANPPFQNSRNFYCSTKQTEKFSKNLSNSSGNEPRSNSGRASENYQKEGSRTPHTNTQPVDDNTGLSRPHEKKPGGYTRGGSTKYHTGGNLRPFNNIRQTAEDSANWSNAYENSEISDDTDRASQTQQNAKDSFDSSLCSENEPRANTSGWTNRNHQKKHSTPHRNVQQPVEYSANLSNPSEPLSHTRYRNPRDQQNYQKSPYRPPINTQQNSEHSFNLSYTAKNEPRPRDRAPGYPENCQRDPNILSSNAQKKINWSDSCETDSRSNTRDSTFNIGKDSRRSSTSAQSHAEGTFDLSNSYEKEQRSNKRDSTNSDYNKDVSRRSSGKYRREVFLDSSDEEKNKFSSYLHSKQANNFKKVQEEGRDLFDVGDDYSLAHCVAEDMNMGSGIAVEFRYRFKKVTELLNQNVGTGGLAILKIGDRFIYYLVTKSRSQGKPTYDSLWSSLIELRSHMKINKVKKLALPTIGCGLDRLDWNVVKPMLEFLFQDEDCQILVCNLQMEGSSSAPLKKCKIVYSTKPVTEIEAETIIIYFASKDGEPTEAMKILDTKFKFASFFQRAPKSIGETVRLVPTHPKNYILYGCIVRLKHDDPFDFIAFEKCLRAIIKNYKKDNYFYIAFQKMSDEVLNAKILNVMKHTLKDMDIHICGYSDSFSNAEE